MADRVQVHGILAEAGWDNIQLQPVDFAFVVGAGKDPVEDSLSYMQAIGPAARAVRMMPEEERAVFIGKLRRFLANNVDGSLIALRAGAWIVTARKPL